MGVLFFGFLIPLLSVFFIFAVESTKLARLGVVVWNAIKREITSLAPQIQIEEEEERGCCNRFTNYFRENKAFIRSFILSILFPLIGSIFALAIDDSAGSRSGAVSGFSILLISLDL